MAKGQKRSNKEPRKLKGEKKKERGPKYLRAPEMVQGLNERPSKGGSKR